MRKQLYFTINKVVDLGVIPFKPILNKFVSKKLFNEKSKTFEKFPYVNQNYVWLETLKSRIENLLQTQSTLKKRIEALKKLQEQKLGIVVSTGRAGTRSLSLFINKIGGLSLHRPEDLVFFNNNDHNYMYALGRKRNEIFYTLHSEKYTDEWLKSTLNEILQVLETVIGFSSKEQKEFWLTAHRWNILIPFLKVLELDYKTIYLTRNNVKIIQSMIDKNQYCKGANVNEEDTWSNFMPIDMSIFEKQEKLEFFDAPEFDMVVWYINFVEHYYLMAIDGLSQKDTAVFDIDKAFKLDEENMINLRNVLDINFDDDVYQKFFTKPQNKKPNQLRALLFTEKEAWKPEFFDRIKEIESCFKKGN